MRVLVVITTLVLVFSGCNASAPGQANQGPAVGNSEALATAKLPNDVQSSVATEIQARFLAIKEVPAQIAIVDGAELDLSPADRANGVTGRWCTRVNFVIRSGPGSPYEDKYRVVDVVRDGTGLRADMHTNYSGKEAEAIDDFMRCSPGGM